MLNVFEVHEVDDELERAVPGLVSRLSQSAALPSREQLVALRELDGTWEEPVVAALAGLVRDRRWPRLILQRYPEALESVLLAEGFTPSPRGLVHYGAAQPVAAMPR